MNDSKAPTTLKTDRRPPPPCPCYEDFSRYFGEHQRVVHLPACPSRGPADEAAELAAELRRNARKSADSPQPARSTRSHSRPVTELEVLRQAAQERVRREPKDTSGYKHPPFTNQEDTRAMALHRRSQLNKDMMAPNQYKAVEELLRKVIDSGISEVGMSRIELRDLTGMPESSAQRALDYVAKYGDWFTRTAEPQAIVNKHAQLRHRRKGYRARYFYRMVDVEVPQDASGDASRVHR